MAGKPLLVALACLLPAACHFIVDIPDESPAWDGGDGDYDADGDGDADTDADSDADSDSDSDVDGDADGDGDADSDGDGDGDLDADMENDPAACPELSETMVLIPGMYVCIDRYEASEGSASKAASAVGVLPWIRISYSDAAAACIAADRRKRICTTSEWFAACGGLEESTYPYGDECSEPSCNGLYHGGGGRVSTGEMPDCEGGISGLFDMSGNVKEWVDDESGGACLRGGSFMSECSQLRCDAEDCLTPEETDTSDRIGFRCCLEL